MDNATVRDKTISEYLRLSLVKAANNEVKMISFLDTPEAIGAKKEAESGQAHLIGSLDDFDKWVDVIADEKKGLSKQ